jgi:hypothetical protein
MDPKATTGAVFSTELHSAEVDQCPPWLLKAINDPQEMELLNVWFAIAPTSEAQAGSSVPQPQIEPLDLYGSDTPPSYYTPKFRNLPPMN